MSSPWLATTTSTSSPADEIDPWSENRSASSSRLGSRAVSSSQLSVRASSSREVDRHPLRSPSPNYSQSSSAGLARRRNAPGQSPDPSGGSSLRTPGGVASEWKAISAGLAGLFGSSAGPSRYQWPEDPVTSSPAISTFNDQPRTKQQHGRTTDDDSEYNKGHSASALDKLEGWFGLRDGHASRAPPISSFSASSTDARKGDAASVSASTESQVRVLIHPVAPSDTLSSLALHYGADIHTLRRSNKLWPGDAVQMRNVIYIPIDSCKHRPPNAEIKVLSSNGGAITPSEPHPGAAALKLAFVPKEDDEVFAISAEPANGEPSAALPTPAQDPASDFMPDTNKSYLHQDNNGAAGAWSIARFGGGGYPSSLAPSSRPDRRPAAPSPLESSAPAGPSSGLRRSHSRAGSVGGSTSASASAASSGFVPPKGPIHVSKISAEKLKFFTPSEKRVEGDEGGPVIGVGPGHPDYRPGESGLDDLLATKLQGASLDPASDCRSQASNSMLTLVRPSLLSQVSDFSSAAASDNYDPDGESEWKPNVWKFGEPRSQSAKNSRSGVRPGTDGDGGAVLFDAGLERSDTPPTRIQPGRSHSGAAEADVGASYNGWNDAPPPHAIVSKAYDGGAAYRKRQHQKHHRLLYDLAAGLPANTGAASKWARPINFGDSLPPSGSAGPVGRNGRTPPPPPSVAGKGFGRLLNDTIRGRISVEGALEAALEEVRNKTALDLPHHEAARQSRTPPPPGTNFNADARGLGEGRQPQATSDISAAGGHELNWFNATAESGGGASSGTWAGRNPDLRNNPTSRAYQRGRQSVPGAETGKGKDD